MQATGSHPGGTLKKKKKINSRAATNRGFAATPSEPTNIGKEWELLQESQSIVSSSTDVQKVPDANQDADQPKADSSKTLFRPQISNFTEAELDSFIRLSEFANPNPRKIKRILSLYVLTRLLVPDAASLRDKVMAWIFLCEQWPVRMSWVMQVIEDNVQMLEQRQLEKRGEMQLYDYYMGFVEKLVFHSMKFFDEVDSSITRRQYIDAYGLDADPELFQKLLRKTDITINDVGDLQMERSSTKLCSYTVGLSPGLRQLVARIASYRVDVEYLQKIAGKSYGSISIMKEDTEQHHYQHNTVRNPANPENLDMSRNVEQNTRTKKAKDVKAMENAKASFKDDKTGKDHIGYSEYAKAISQIVVFFVELPCIFGLYAVWGTGKSFTMNKISSFIKGCYISQLVQAHGDDQGHVSLAEDICKIASEEDSMDLVFKWLAIGCPESAIQGPGLSDLQESAVLTAWSERQSAVYDESDSDLFSVMISLILGLMSILTKPSWHVLCSARACAKRRAFISSNTSLELLAKVWKEAHGDNAVEYEFVWFNAWLFCGSENLWAGFAVKLHEAVETHFGPSYAQAERKANLISGVAKILAAVALLAFGIALMMNIDAFDPDFADIESTVAKIFGGIVSTGVACVVALQQLFSIAKLPRTPSQSTSNRASSSRFKEQLGYMDTIKSEIDTIASYLNSPGSVPTFWDKLLPPGWDMLGCVVKILKKIFHRRTHSLRQCRLIIFVDDLDRCPPEKVLEVLQALVLLCEATPFIVFLAVDPRVIVNAVESVNVGFFRASGISGYEFLDKIVQVPFSFPVMSDDEKSNLLRGLLTGTSTTDHVEFVDADNDTCRYELRHINSFTSKIKLTVNGEVPNYGGDGYCTSFKFQSGRLADSVGIAPLPHSVSSSVVRQISALAKRAKPPIPVTIGS